ncbi:MAG: cation acetate symporter [Betaproteobacteria bacterium]|nr:cation acetate symporter [Betaproteobacteria bacterium]
MMNSNVWNGRCVLVGVISVVLLTIAMVTADQWGVSKSLINSFFLIISLIGYAVVGMVCRTSQADQYYVAAREVTAHYNGMATAADWMSAASFIGLTGLLLADGYVGDGQKPGGLAYVLGWTGGFCLLGLLFAAKLNQTQSITIPEMLGVRFDSAIVRWIAAWGAILCSSVYLVAQIYGIGLVASLLSGLTFELGVFLALGGVLLCSFLGGMRAVTWTQVVQCVVIVFAMLSIAVAVSWRSQGHPFVPLAADQAMQEINERVDYLKTNLGEVTTQLAIKNRIAVLDQKIQSPDAAHQLEKQEIGQKIEKLKAENGPLRDLHRFEMSIAWRDSTSERLVESWKKERAEILNNLSRPVGFQAFFEAETSGKGLMNTLALVFCLMTGTAALPHLLIRSFTAVSPTQAKRSIVWALMFVVIVYLSASALAVMLKNAVLFELIGSSMLQLPEWADQLKMKKLALLSITDWNLDGIVQSGDIRFGSDYLVLAAPEILHVSPVFTGLIAAGALAAALSTADGLLLTISNALAHDLYFETFSASVTPLRRVMLSKILLMVVALVAAWVATNQPVDILFWVACAFSLAAATFFPVMLLGFHWTGVTRSGAIAAMLGGLGITLYYIFVNQPWVQTKLGLSSDQTLWWGLEPICAGIWGVPSGIVLGVVVSLLTRAKKVLNQL